MCSRVARRATGNPLNIGEPDAFAEANGILPYSDEEFIAWFRHAEIKHGRVAMAAFVGFLVQSNVCFPWDIAKGVSHADIFAAGGPGAQWDALSTTAKFQIFTFIFILEAIGESSYALEKRGAKHYMRGGKPGYFPSLKAEGVLPHPVPLDLFDPFGLTKKLTPEQKATKLLAEINNGAPPPRRRTRRVRMSRRRAVCAASVRGGRPPRHDRHHGAVRRVQGPDRARPRLAAAQAVRRRVHGTLRGRLVSHGCGIALE